VNNKKIIEEVLSFLDCKKITYIFNKTALQVPAEWSGAVKAKTLNAAKSQWKDIFHRVLLDAANSENSVNTIGQMLGTGTGVEDTFKIVKKHNVNEYKLVLGSKTVASLGLGVDRNKKNLICFFVNIGHTMPTAYKRKSTYYRDFFNFNRVYEVNGQEELLAEFSEAICGYITEAARATKKAYKKTENKQEMISVWNSI
jgi:hypothetical protein